MASESIYTTPPTTTPAPTAGLTPNVYTAIPGLNNLVGSASANIGNLLSGLPSPSWAQTSNAYFGAGAGQPGGGGAGSFIGNRGADLYQQQAQANRQTGLADLSNLVGTASGNLAPTAAQNQQAGEFEQQLASNQFTSLLNSLIGALGNV